MAEYAEKSDETGEKTPKKGQGYWTKQLMAAEKRQKKFLKQGNLVVQRFLDERGAGDPYERSRGDVPSRLNLFHKNISTIMAMMFGQTPKLDVTREHYDPDDDVARVAALIIQRMLQTDVNPSGSDLASVLNASLQDRLLPGLGVARVRYAFDTETSEAIDPETMEIEEIETVTDERAPIEYVHWQDNLWGWGRTWNEIPWWGFRAWMDKYEVEERFGEKVAKNLEYKRQSASDDDSGDPDQHKDNVEKAEIWEIWCKAERKVYWYSKGQRSILDEKDDPLQLRGFWPMPRPMMANLTTTMMMPKADFLIAQDLYNEIDELQSRISVITKAVKVVGVYDKGAGDSVGRMLKEGVENDLIPVDNWAMFAEKGGLQGTIQWFPVQEIVATLQVLQAVQQEKMSQLYEVVGLSDIMRGANTDQYTAAKTQGMKAKMGSISIQALQDEFARFASELEGLKAEIIAKHYERESIVDQSNAGFLPEADKGLVAPALNLIQSPDVKWRVNIKPETLAMIDYAQIKSERTEFLMSMAQFIQSATGAIQAVPGSTPILLELMKWGMAGFKGAEYLEGTFDQAIDMAKQMPPPGQEQDKGPSPEEIKLQVEQMKLQGQQQKLQGELQKIQAKAQADIQTQQAKIQTEIQKIQTDHQRDMTIEDVRVKNRLLEIAREMEAQLRETEVAMQSSLTIEQAQAQYDIASQDNDHENTMREIAASKGGD
jgi:hypothetical protein